MRPAGAQLWIAVHSNDDSEEEPGLCTCVNLFHPYNNFVR